MPITRELADNYFGVNALGHLTASDVTVGTAAARIVVGNPMCRWLAISNFGSTPIVVAPRQSVTTTTGIPVGAGDTLILTWAEDYELVVLDWFAISSAAGQAVHIESGIGEFNAPQ